MVSVWGIQLTIFISKGHIPRPPADAWVNRENQVFYVSWLFIFIICPVKFNLEVMHWKALATVATGNVERYNKTLERCYMTHSLRVSYYSVDLNNLHICFPFFITKPNMCPHRQKVNESKALEALESVRFFCLGQHLTMWPLFKAGFKFRDLLPPECCD